MENKKIKVLLAKPGLDGHDRAIKTIARVLREAGMEVIYTGLRQTPEMIVQTSLEEDVDVIGLSTLSGAHLELLPKIMTGLKKQGLGEVMVIVGGIIPQEDVSTLTKIGVKAVFGPGTNTQEIVDFIQSKF